MGKGGGAGGDSLPVMFFDGVCETEIGKIGISPPMEFKRFQSALSVKIGILPHQFSTFLTYPGNRRKIPITAKFNFGKIPREKGCFVSVELKRSQRDRRLRNHQDYLENDFNYTSPTKVRRPIKANPPENVMLLRRNTGINRGLDFSGFNSFSAEQIEHEKRVLELQLERDRYLVKMSLLEQERNQRSLAPSPVGAAICEECLKTELLGEEAGFHLCVNDAVISGFRSSPAGPIIRPVHRSD